MTEPVPLTYSKETRTRSLNSRLMRAANNNNPEAHGEKLVGLFRRSAQFYACDPTLIPEHTQTHVSVK